MFVLLTDFLTNKLIAIKPSEVLKMSSADSDSSTVITLKNGDVEYVKENIKDVCMLMDR